MFDLGISKMALIGAVALIVIGPEKLPRVARTVGTLLGKAQRYVNDVKSEVNRSMELDELRKMKENVESAARDVENTIRTNSADFEKNLNDQANGLASSASDDSFYTADPYAESYDSGSASAVAPVYHHPRKNWRGNKARRYAPVVQAPSGCAHPCAIGRSTRGTFPAQKAIVRPVMAPATHQAPGAGRWHVFSLAFHRSAMVQLPPGAARR